MKHLRRSLLASVLAASLLPTLIALNGTASQASGERVGQEGHRNLQVLPKDYGRGRLGNLMLDMLSGLGLPRRAGEGCLHCHVGSLDTDRSQWDYASDAKPAKAKARVMLAMMLEINKTHLAQLDERSQPRQEVTCYTCHRGRLNPAPLEDVLRSKLASGGIEALESTYAELHAKHYEADAYDFRAGTLMALGDELVDRGEIDDALRVHQLNAKFSRDPRALGGEVLVIMQDALAGDGIEAMLEAYHALKEEHPAEAFRPGLLSGLGWKLFRSGARQAGFQLFELNYKEHPGSFPGTEDLAYGCQAMGDGERALKLARAWIEKHPEHKQGQQLLFELQR